MYRNIIYLLILSAPTSLNACMLGPSLSSVLTFGIIKITIGVVAVFFILKMMIQNRTIRGQLLLLTGLAIIASSLYSIIVYRGLYNGPDCSTPFGTLTGLFFLSALFILMIVFVARKLLHKR
jgi:hypothetical protein